jgi:Domain of unknown function (DUF6458)
VGIGTSIFLIAVGAILTFALDVSLGGVDLDVVGWILMGAGILGLVITTMIWGNRRREVVTTEPATEYRRVEERPVDYRPAEYRRVEERRDVGPPL